VPLLPLQALRVRHWPQPCQAYSHWTNLQQQQLETVVVVVVVRTLVQHVTSR
jgi:hypothetical protein